MKKLTLALTTICFAFLNIQLVKAGDFAEFQSLGFSEDGSVYVFEQFGTQDGSGFPYAERFFINTQTDTFVKGTPIKVMLEDEQATALSARQMVAEKSAGLMVTLGIGNEMGKLVAFNPFTETNNNSKQIKYHANHFWRETRPPFEVFIENFTPKLPEGHDCINYSLPVQAFALKLRNTPDEAAELVYTDKSVPSSRGCPQDYHMGGVVAFDVFGKTPVHVFLILIERFGFEGPDGRWIAVPKVFKK